MQNIELQSRQKPDFDKLKIFMDQQLPRDKDKKPYSCPAACCKVSTGSNFCCLTSPVTDVD